MFAGMGASETVTCFSDLGLNEPIVALASPTYVKGMSAMPSDSWPTHEQDYYWALGAEWL